MDSRYPRNVVIHVTKAATGDAVVERLQVHTHRVGKSKRHRCHQCQARLVFFWSKRNCHMVTNVHPLACQAIAIDMDLLMPVDRPATRMSKAAPTPIVQAKVCLHCVDVHFNKPPSPHNRPTKRTNAAEPPPLQRTATKIWLQSIVTSKQPRHESRRSGRHSVHRSSIHRPMRNHAFDSPRVRRTSRHSQRLYLPPKPTAKWTNPWCPPPVLPDESERLQTLRSFHILDTASEDICDILCTLAATTYSCAVAGVTFMDKDRQWFKARHGLKQDEIPRKVALCAHAMASPTTPMVVLDTDDDSRFAKNPLVTGHAQFKFYMSVPIVTPLGHPLGTIFVADTKPRQRADADELEKLAVAVLQFLMDRLNKTDHEDVVAAHLWDQRGTDALCGMDV
ncbi:hypothetical protein DYB37_007183 [Aphanomyces astaci]|uniref:GAF domain-containing protein n=1 Tax=Aphanomyces astaci TaxID=112090 RepID=A0A418F0L6_APHAT|nr:hypothetical protein DYB37_007183 [Aphanomyces astaci]